MAARRLGVLLASLSVATSLTIVLGPACLWPLFLLPLLAGSLLLFEGGAALAAVWAAACGAVVGETSAARPASSLAVGGLLYLLAGLLVARSRRRAIRWRHRLAASNLIDRLTGVYNYGTFADYLRTEVRKAQRYGGHLALVMLDLDHFKHFNDTHGHQAGNALLRSLGATLRGLVRGADLVARYGGEEFAILLRGDELDGLRLAERVRRAVLLLAVPVPGGEAYVTVSCGVACYPEDARSDTELVEHADAALYASKQGGRNCVTGYTLGRMEGRTQRRRVASA
jgi:diguanylate cyclase (GGDEF)-like protein